MTGLGPSLFTVKVAGKFLRSRPRPEKYAWSVLKNWTYFISENWVCPTDWLFLLKQSPPIWDEIIYFDHKLLWYKQYNSDMSDLSTALHLMCCSKTTNISLVVCVPHWATEDSSHNLYEIDMAKLLLRANSTF